MKTAAYLKLERRIATGERGGVIERWRYGRELLAARSGRKQLPHGMIADLVAAAAKVGIALTETEIRRRLRCAEAYDSEAKVGRAATDFGGWWALVEAGFPPVESDGSDPEHLEAEGLDAAADEWNEGEQLHFEIPGLKSAISIRGRKVPLVRGEDGATVGDVAAYLAMCTEMHENFGKTVEQISNTLATMREGSGGDDQANAVEAWEAATEGLNENDDESDEAAS